jgi:hypothetical protein
MLCLQPYVEINKALFISCFINTAANPRILSVLSNAIDGFEFGEEG